MLWCTVCHHFNLLCLSLVYIFCLLSPIHVCSFFLSSFFFFLHSSFFNVILVASFFILFVLASFFNLHSSCFVLHSSFFFLHSSFFLLRSSVFILSSFFSLLSSLFLHSLFSLVFTVLLAVLFAGLHCFLSSFHLFQTSCTGNEDLKWDGEELVDVVHRVLGITTDWWRAWSSGVDYRWAGSRI